MSPEERVTIYKDWHELIVYLDEVEQKRFHIIADDFAHVHATELRNQLIAKLKGTETTEGK